MTSETIAPIADFDADPILALHGAALTTDARADWIAYLSSTGVYGEHGGEWVDEEAELRCTDAKSLARVAAEARWAELEGPSDSSGARFRRVERFRCGGIYGPGTRNPLRRMVNEIGASGAPGAGSAAATKFVNRIHVDDIAGALLAAACTERSAGGAFNLVDDEPAPRAAVAAESRRLLGMSVVATASGGLVYPAAADGVAPPTLAVATRSPRMRESLTGNKRVSNGKLKAAFDYTLLAPTYREGLKRLL